MDPRRNKQLRQKRDQRDRRLAKGSTENSDKVIKSAVEALKRGDVEDCLDKCNDVIKSNPSHVAAYMLRGRAYLAMENCGEAIRVVSAALGSGIDDAMLWCELGNLYSENGEQDNAVSAWKTALARDSNSHIARKNLAFALFEMNQLQDAENHLVTLLQHDPSDLPAMRTLAILWNKQSKYQQAAEILETALKQYPSDGTTYKLLSSIYRSGQELEKYKLTLMRWLKAEPQNAIATHLIAGTIEQTAIAPERASDEYIREVFDQFAATFDSDLAHLHYEAPIHVARALERLYGSASTQTHPLTRMILDAGCGTGICGPLLRPYTRTLVGVDLSSQMIKVASERSCYDALEVAELTAYLRQHPNSFDSIVGCDTFNYFGDLSELLEACCSAMKDDGVLIITLEHEHQSDCGDYKLNINGRYTHCRWYVQQTADDANLRTIGVEDVLLRAEANLPVEGLLVTLQKQPTNSI